MTDNSLKSELTKLWLIKTTETRTVSDAADELGIPLRTCYDFLAKKTWGDWWKEYDWQHSGWKIASEKGKEVTQTTTSVPISKSSFLWPLTLPEISKKDTDEDNSRILLISDPHIPYHHPDAIKFLQYLKDKYNPTRVICMGDELDKHALSFHDSDPDLPSAGDELRLSLPIIKQLKEMFPVMDILESNHGSLLYRKAHAHGIPKQYLRTYNEVLEVDDGWKWWYDMTINLPNGNKCYLHHGKSTNITKTSQTMSMCAAAGHYHETFKVEYWGNPNGLYWAMQTGCLINDKAYAFNYNNCNLKRPIIGTGLIINSMPILEPMVLSSEGRWIGR